MSGPRLTRKAIMLGGVAAFALVTLAMSALVSFAVISVTGTANSLDDTRSRSTVSAALGGVITQLSSISRDNAFWDDAAIAAYQTNDIEWFVETWGVDTKDYAVYNEAIVIEADGTPVMAYDNGEKLAWSPSSFYGPSYEILLGRSRRTAAVASEAGIESAFVMTPQGLSIVSLAPILPTSSNIKFNPEKRRFLILSRQIDAEDIAALGDAYVVPGLTFATNPEAGLMTSPVTDSTGQTIGYLAWPPQMPGDASFRAVTPLLAAALAMLGLMLAGFAAYSQFLVKTMRRDSQQAEFESTHDPLSSLLNRSGLFRTLSAKLGVRRNSQHLTLVYMDLDGFKDVNDSYGHSVGDELIRKVAGKLAAQAPKGAIVSRLGGDEFAVLLHEDAGSNDADAVAAAIHQLFKEPFDIAGRTVIVGASIGIAHVTETVTDSAELVRQADLAMYRAKDLGRGRTVVYEAAFDKDRAEQNLLESDLREAIAANDLEVAFQPLVDANTSQWHGLEALARWYNRRLGKSIGPDVFIPLAERSGLIELLGLQVLRKALVESLKWPDLKISVNVSPAQFRNPAFPEHVARILHETGADPTQLTLEITEGFFVRNPERAQRIVQALKALGISISLDDFGTGFSSIGYLRQFAFDRLKIDRSFIQALDHEANAPNVIQATVALANAFNIPVTAEGIEREDQAVILRLSGCDEFQGFLFGRPMAASDIDRIVNHTAPMAVSAA